MQTPFPAGPERAFYLSFGMTALSGKRKERKEKSRRAEQKVSRYPPIFPGTTEKVGQATAKNRGLKEGKGKKKGLNEEKEAF